MASVNNALQQAEQSQQNAAHGQHDLLASHSSTTTPQFVEAEAWGDAIQLLGELQLRQFEDEIRLLFDGRQVVAREGVNVGSGHGEFTEFLRDRP